MASPGPITSYFNTVMLSEHLATAFQPREPGKKTVKRPVGRPRKRRAEDESLLETASVANVGKENLQPTADDGEESVKGIRLQYSTKQKKRVVMWARHHRVRPTERKFSIPRKNIQRWLKASKDNDFDEGPSKRGPKKQRTSIGRQKAGRKLNYPREVDDKVLEWVLCMREKHLPISTQMLRDKALALIKPHNPNFKASDGWVRKFIRRHNLVLRARTSVAQKLPSDLEDKIETFYVDVRTERQKYDYPKELIGNKDETPIYFDMVPSRTLDKKGVKEVRVKTTGAEKRRVTVVLACTASGKTLPPMIIFKGKFNILLHANSCSFRQHFLYRQNKTSHKGTEVSIWHPPSFPEEFMDEQFSDASVSQGDLAEVYQESEESPCLGPVQSTLG